MARYGNRAFRGVVTLLEWMLKRVMGPGWRPAGAVRELPPSALVFDVREDRRAEDVFRRLAALGFDPRRVPVATDDPRGIGRTIAKGAADCWATVVLEPMDDAAARSLGPAFRNYAHLHPDVVAVVAGPLPSRAEILDRYRHVVTSEDGGVSSDELAAVLAHASAARVLHCARLLNTAVVSCGFVAAAVGLGLAWVTLAVAGR